MKSSYTGYIIVYRGMTVYFGGDTAYDRELFVETAERFPGIDVALMPVSPIHPREYSGARHTDPAEALLAFRDLEAKWLIPMHYDTFQESLDTLGEAMTLMKHEMKRGGFSSEEVVIIDIGEQYLFPVQP